jgi:hypothetical protein
MQKNNDFDFESILSSKKNISNQIESESEKFDNLEMLLSKERKISFELKKQISSCGQDQILISCDASNNHAVLVALVKKVISAGKKPIVVLTSINFKTANELFLEAKLNPSEVFLLDTISKNLINILENKNLKFADSLRNLTQIQIKILDFIESINTLNQEVVLIFDSINILELYHEEKIIYKFIYAITKMLHKNKLAGVFILSKKELTPNLGQFFDNIVEIEKVE